VPEPILNLVHFKCKNNPLKSRIELCDYSTKNMVITSFEPEQWLKCRAQELQTYKTLHF